MRENKERNMPDAVIKDWDQFNAFLSTQPFCMWAAEKQQEILTGTTSNRGQSSSASKNDNAELAAALASMA